MQARTVAAALGVAVLLGAAAPAGAATIYATTGTKLLHFDSATPGTFPTPDTITGLVNGQQLVSIDFDPATGNLYGLGQLDSAGPTESHDKLYIIDPGTAAASAVTGAINITGSVSAFLGMDFNARFDNIFRWIQDDDVTNHSRSTDSFGSFDGTVGYPTGDANETTDPDVVGVAFDHSRHGTTTTTGYAIDRTPSPDQLARLTENDNDGDINSSSPIQLTTWQNLGTLDVGTRGGFDIEAGSDMAYAALQPGGAGAWKLYTIDLANGTPSAGVDITTDPILGIAIAPTARVRFAATEDALLEDESLTITLQRVEPTGPAFDVEWSLTGGTADPDDVTGPDGVVAFGVDETEKTFEFPIADDDDFEGDETAELELVLPTDGAFVAEPHGMTVTIKDDDPAPPAPPPGGNGDGDGNGSGDPPPGPPAPPPITVGPPPLVDGAAPALRLQARRQKARRARRRGLRFTLSLDEAASVSAELRVRGRRVGRVLTRSLVAGQRGLRLRFRRRLKPRTLVTIRVTARDAAGNVATRSVRVRLRR